MPLLLTGGIAAAMFLTAWGAVELGDLVRAYPAQFVAGCGSFLFACAGIVVRKFRKANEWVPLPPPPLPRALPAAPARAELPPLVHRASRICENGRCMNPAGPDPWTAEVEGEEGAPHVFCSRECAQEWGRSRPASRRW